jgi:hypothetical protein
MLQSNDTIAETNQELTEHQNDSKVIYGTIDARLHRLGISLKITHVLISYWLISGMSFWIAILFSSLVNVAYVTFHISTGISMFGPLWGFGIITLVSYVLFKSLIRTTIVYISLILKSRGVLPLFVLAFL